MINLHTKLSSFHWWQMRSVFEPSGPYGRREMLGHRRVIFKCEIDESHLYTIFFSPTLIWTSNIQEMKEEKNQLYN